MDYQHALYGNVRQASMNGEKNNPGCMNAGGLDMKAFNIICGAFVEKSFQSQWLGRLVRVHPYLCIKLEDTQM